MIIKDLNLKAIHNQGTTSHSLTTVVNDHQRSESESNSQLAATPPSIIPSCQ